MTPPELARKTAWSTAAQVCQSIRGLFPLLVARLVGPAAVAMLGVGWAWTDLASKFSIWGSDQATTIHVARHLTVDGRSAAGSLLRHALRSTIARSAALAAVLSGTCLFIASRFDGQVPEAIAWLMWTLPFLAAYRVANAGSWGAGHVEHGVLSKGLTESLVTIAAFFLLWRLDLGERAALAAVVVGYAASATVAAALALRTVPTTRARPSAETQRRFRADARWIGLGDLLYLANMRLDVLLLGAWVGLRTSPSTASASGLPITTDLAAVGAYALAVEIAFGAKKVRNLFEPLFVPLLTAQRTRANAQRRDKIETLQRWMFTWQLAFAGTLLLGARPLLAWFGDTFLSAVPWLGLLLLANILNGFLFSESSLRIVAPNVNARVNGLGALSNLLLSSMSIPVLGPLGAAISTTVAYGGMAAVRLHTLARAGVSLPFGVIATPALRALACATIAVAVSSLLARCGVELAVLPALLYCLAYGLLSCLQGGRRTVS